MCASRVDILANANAPVQLQQAHDELAHVRRMKMDKLKQKASDVTGDDSGSKTELIARITDAVLENAAT